MEKVIATGYLYTEWEGTLTVKEGTVVRNQWCYGSNEAIFRYGPGERDWVRCHVEPKKFVGAKFWLPKRNDKLGKKMLIEYHEDIIDKKLREVASHEKKIYQLRNA